MVVEPFVIESEQEADDYLQAVLEKQEYRSMDEVQIRAQKYVNDERLKSYFIEKATEILRAYGVA